MALSTAQINSLSLDTAMRAARDGYLTRAEWLAYAHAWQTGAARFEIRACNCAECVKNFPAPDYKPLTSPV